MIIPYCLFPKIFPKDVNKPYDKRRVFDFDCCAYVKFWGYCMLRMCDVRDVGCSGCGMFEMSDVGDVGCWRCGMWDVRDVGYLGCDMFGMWDVQDLECSGCGMFGMRDVRDVGCLLRCGKLIYKMPKVF